MRAALLACAVVLFTGGGALWLGTDAGRALTTESARRINVAETRPAIPDATLETMTGAHVPLHPPPGEVAAVEFIYTTCPTICQSAGAEFARLRDATQAEGLPLRLISVSFDPETDDPDHLADYAGWHGADGTAWTVARPTPADLPGLLQGFGVTVIPDGWGGFIHNTAIHLVDDQGRLAAIVDYDDIDGALAAARALLP
jgi:protein SCO1/2